MYVCYFVIFYFFPVVFFFPLVSGNLYSYINDFILLISASNAGSELFLSSNASPKKKEMISEVDGGFPTGQYEYNRYTRTLLTFL